MLIVDIPAQLFGTNGYVVAPKRGDDCVVIDPGIGVARAIEDVLDTYRLRPAAVMITHGHLDHVWSVAPVCGANDIPAYIHPDDTKLLRDPMAALSQDMVQEWAATLKRLTWTVPDNVREMTDSSAMDIAGMTFKVDHCPGHTAGSVMFGVPGDSNAPSYYVTGDMLFANSCGRTDLPGASPEAMMDSMRTKVLPLGDDTVVLPGHGPRTAIGVERQRNRFMRMAAEQPDQTQIIVRG